MMMRTNIIIDDELLGRALKLSGLKTKRAVVNEALLEYVRSLTRKSLADLEGSDLLLDDYDYKLARGGKDCGAGGHIGADRVSEKKHHRENGAT